MCSNKNKSLEYAINANSVSMYRYNCYKFYTSKYCLNKKINKNILFLNFFFNRNLILINRSSFFIVKEKKRISLIFKKENNLQNYYFINKIIPYNLFQYKKVILLLGLGYQLKRTKNYLQIKLGYSHSILFYFNRKIILTLEKKNKKLTLISNDLQMLNRILFYLKNLRKMNYYKTKGFYFFKEKIKLKIGKVRK